MGFWLWAGLIEALVFLSGLGNGPLGNGPLLTQLSNRSALLEFDRAVLLHGDGRQPTARRWPGLCGALAAERAVHGGGRGAGGGLAPQSRGSSLLGSEMGALYILCLDMGSLFCVCLWGD